MPSFSIRTLLEENFANVRQLSESLGRSCDPGQWGADECRLAVVTENGDLAAWARSHFWDPADPVAPAGYYLGGVEVAIEFQGMGLAQRLTQARLAWVSLRARQVFCITNARNAASISLQRSMGFSELARAAAFGSVRFTGGEGILFRREIDECDAALETTTFEIETREQ